MLYPVGAIALVKDLFETPSSARNPAALRVRQTNPRRGRTVRVQLAEERRQLREQRRLDCQHAAVDAPTRVLVPIQPPCARAE